ncbi:hypothetical protein C1I59_10125 [Paenibacillus polymyxa]|nr:hypothetical protein C1I59_10125 [Paenibacillus polymyxa]
MTVCGLCSLRERIILPVAVAPDFLVVCSRVEIRGKGERSASSDNTVLSAALFLLATTCLYRKNEFAYVDGFGELTRHKNLLVETARRITCSRFYFSA